MTGGLRQGLIKRQRLTDAEVTEIEQLAYICNSYENLHMRIGWVKLRPQRSNVTLDFLYYENGMLAGYLLLDGNGKTVEELTGMVHPDHRRKGIFSALLAAAKEECGRRGVQKLKLICERSSRSGQAFVAATGARCDSKEYKMVLETFHETMLFDERLYFQEAQESEIEALATITIDGFGESKEQVRSLITKSFQEPNGHYYISTFGEASLGCKEPVGCLKLYEMEDEIGIYGFVVRADYRGRGYGRQMLEEVIRNIRSRSQKRIILEVDSENTTALGLYRSSGFKETTTYDYCTLDIK